MDGLKTIIENTKLPNSLKREHVTPIITIATATALLYTFIKSKSYESKKGYKEIPVPKERYPYIGHLLSLTSTPGRRVAQWHDELGPIIRIQMGVETWIMIDDPILAQKVFVTNGAETAYRRQTILSFEHYSLKGLGLVYSQPGPIWKRSRGAALSLLAPKQVENYRLSINTESEELVARLIKTTDEKGSVDPSRDLLLSTFNVIYTVGFGTRYTSIDDPEYKEMGQMLKDCMLLTGPKNNMGKFIPIIKIFDYYAGTEAKIKHYMETVRTPMMRKLIKAALLKEGPNLTKNLLSEEIGMTEDEVLVFLSDILITGTDTISVTLGWAFAILTHHPEVQKRICEEIDAFIRIHKRLPSFEEREDFPYCISVIKECMRFRPTAPLGVPHTTVKDLVVDGYFIPKGAILYSTLESMHRRSGNFYSDADKFIPERFMGNLKTMQSAANGKFEERDHFNFGWGRRICPGIALAEAEIFSVFVQLFSKCTIEPLSPQELPDIEGTLAEGAVGTTLPYNVKFSRRGNALL